MVSFLRPRQSRAMLATEEAQLGAAGPGRCFSWQPSREPVPAERAATLVDDRTGVKPGRATRWPRRTATKGRRADGLTRAERAELRRLGTHSRERRVARHQDAGAERPARSRHRPARPLPALALVRRHALGHEEARRRHVAGRPCRHRDQCEAWNFAGTSTGSQVLVGAV